MRECAGDRYFYDLAGSSGCCLENRLDRVRREWESPVWRGWHILDDGLDLGAVEAKGEAGSWLPLWENGGFHSQRQIALERTGLDTMRLRSLGDIKDEVLHQPLGRGLSRG